MLESRYIEDIFTNFVSLCSNRQFPISGQDWSAIKSFDHIVASGNQLTKNQANFLIKILQKYKMFAKSAGLDYANDLQTPVWKKDFRVLDLSKKISVEKDEEGTLWFLLKFPFALKEVLEKEISPISKDFSSSVWDHENKVRRMRFYNYNPIEIYEFVQRHQFQIDETFMDALAEVEEIWENYEKILPGCEVTESGVILKNASDVTNEYFSVHRTGVVGSDLLLAKSMGHFFTEKPQTALEKIASTPSTHFHLKTLDDFFKIYKDVNQTVVVIVNRGNDSDIWVKEFCEFSKNFDVPTSDIRVCYRLDKTDNSGFNQWVKDSGYGGKVEGAKILIFQNKPPKWLFSDDISVKIILTNSLYPVPSSITQTWMDTHSCVCFVGNIKAAGHKDKKIVEL